jgi:hypothetical protein
LALDQKNTLAAMANVQRRSTSALIREAIDCYIAQHAEANKLARRKQVAGGWQPNVGAPSLIKLRHEERSV